MCAGGGMADTGDLKSPEGDFVRVRIPLCAPIFISRKEMIFMKRTKEDEILMLKVRIAHVVSRGYYEDCPGVLKKLERKLRNLTA